MRIALFAALLMAFGCVSAYDETYAKETEMLEQAEQKRQAEEAADRLRGVSCTVRVQADESDKLYGAVHERDIAAALGEQGVEIDPQWIVLEEPIKMLGVYPVKIHLFKDVDAEIKVWVIRE